MSWYPLTWNQSTPAFWRRIAWDKEWSIKPTILICSSYTSQFCPKSNLIKDKIPLLNARSCCYYFPLHHDNCLDPHENLKVLYALHESILSTVRLKSSINKYNFIILYHCQILKLFTNTAIGNRLWRLIKKKNGFIAYLCSCVYFFSMGLLSFESQIRKLR